MDRIKVTYYLDANLVKRARLAATATDSRDYQVIEEALSRYLEGNAGRSVAQQVTRLFAGAHVARPVDEDAAVRLAQEAVAGVNAEMNAQERAEMVADADLGTFVEADTGSRTEAVVNHRAQAGS